MRFLGRTVALVPLNERLKLPLCLRFPESIGSVGHRLRDLIGTSFPTLCKLCFCAFLVLKMALTRSKCIPNWKKCESCQTILSQNNLDAHSTYHCPPLNIKSDWSYGHIYEKKLFSFLKVFEPQGLYTSILID